MCLGQIAVVPIGDADVALILGIGIEAERLLEQLYRFGEPGLVARAAPFARGLDRAGREGLGLRRIIGTSRTRVPEHDRDEPDCERSVPWRHHGPIIRARLGSGKPGHGSHETAVCGVSRDLAV
jgi:hypothetical protein